MKRTERLFLCLRGGKRRTGSMLLVVHVAALALMDGAELASWRFLSMPRP